MEVPFQVLELQIPLYSLFKRIGFIEKEDKKIEDTLYESLNNHTSKIVANEKELSQTTVNRLKEQHNYSKISAFVIQKTIEEAVVNKCCCCCINRDFRNKVENHF